MNTKHTEHKTPDTHPHHEGESHMAEVLDKTELILRNLFAVAATVLFLISIFSGHPSGTLKFVAYLCGAGAYVCEYLHLTKDFHEKIPHDELFMVYCFAPLYLLLGLSYLLH